MTEAEARSRLRRMVAADKAPTLDDEDLDSLMTYARTTDRYGALPTEDGWTPTFRLARAALEGWRWKAAKVAGDFDSSSDGASYSRSQKLDHCERMIKMYARKAGTSMMPVTAGTEDATSDVIGNL